MFCRNCNHSLDDRAVACTQCGMDPRAGQAFCGRCGTATLPNQVYCRNCGSALETIRPGSDPRAQKKILAGVFGLLLGMFGVHKFILGYTGAGLIMLLVTILSCGMAWPVMYIIGMVEGILYLTKSDDEFVRTYVVGRREWF